MDKEFPLEQKIEIIKEVLLYYRSEYSRPTCTQIYELGARHIPEIYFLIDEYRKHSKAYEGSLGFKDIPNFVNASWPERTKIRRKKLEEFLAYLRS